MFRFNLTPQAARQIPLAAERCGSTGMFLRITARPGDAGAVIHGMGFDEMREDDVLLQPEGIQVVITPDHLPLLDGATLDFVTLNTGDTRFVFVNPNDLGCACGLGNCGCCDVGCRPQSAQAAGSKRCATEA